MSVFKRNQAKDSKLIWWQILLALSVAAIIRAWVLSVTENGIDFHFNAYDRPIFTWNDWMNSHRWIPLIDYGPVHFYFLRFLFYFSGYDLFLMPGILSLVFGVASILPLMRITRRNFGQRAALWAGLGCAFYPLGIRLSTVSLEVTIFHFFVLVALDFLDKGLSKKRGIRIDLVIAGSWLTVACATRFEGWLMIPVFTGVILTALLRKTFLENRRPGLKTIFSKAILPVILFGLAASLFPLFWMVASYKMTGDPTNFASISAVVQKIHALSVPFIDRALGWPIIFFQTTTFITVLVIIVGLVVSVAKKEGLYVLVIALFMFALFILLAIRGAMALNETKYISTITMMLLPFFGFGAAWLGQNISPRNHLVVSMVIVMAAGIVSMGAVNKDNIKFAPSENVKSLCKNLSTLSEEEGKVLLGVRYQGYIIARSGLSYERFVLVPGDDKTGHRSPDDFWRIVKREAPCVIIHNTLPDMLDFQKIIPIDGKTKKEATLSGYNFKSIFISDQWMLLSVTRAE